MKPQELSVRRPTARDVAQAAEIMVAARRESVPSIPPPVHTDSEIRRWFTDHVAVTYDVWVAAAGPTVVGVLVLSDDWIEHLYVEPSRTGCGVGSMLVDHAKEHSDGELLLWTFVSNTGARRFYERHGFVDIDRTDGDNEEGAPDIKYRWRRSAGRPGA